MQKKILVVEDDEFSQFVMVEMCKSLGYDCLVANDGEECLEVVTEHGDDIALVLMDIHMPKVSGLVAATEIRDHPENPPNSLPIVATTADINWQDPEICRDHGFSHVISKPIGFDLLAQAVDRFVPVVR